MLKILFINPVGTDAFDGHILKTINQVKRPDVEVKVVHLTSGPVHLEYHYYEHLNMEETLRWVKWAENEGYDAVIIGCFYDPGLREAREIVSIPVIGVAEATMHVAATLGHKFSIIVGRRKWIPKMESNVYLYGIERKLASFRVINFTVPRMLKEPEMLKQAIINEAKKAVEEDGAEVIVLGCTGESGFVKELIEKIKVPVLDPVVISWKFAEMLADLYQKLKLSHCKLYGYESPPSDEGYLPTHV
ncbi:MAG: aspartate/glutamate racemase family protein [Candidatus Bathyarchaeia archaeon]